jgi:hypothetical protein
VKRKRKPLSTGTAQLDGALALLGARNEVAGYDRSVFVRRAGELIARAADGKRPQKPQKSEDKRGDRRVDRS